MQKTTNRTDNSKKAECSFIHINYTYSTHNAHITNAKKNYQLLLSEDYATIASIRIVREKKGAPGLARGLFRLFVLLHFDVRCIHVFTIGSVTVGGHA